MDFVREWARRTPDAPAVVGLPGEGAGEAPVWTYRELHAWVDRVASALQGAGVGPGDTVAMRLPPCPEAVVLLHSVARVGGVFVPLNAAWTEAEAARGISAVGPPALIFTTVGEVVPWDGEGPAEAPFRTGDFPSARSGAPAAVILTSGTTGEPRPIRLSHRNLTASAHGVGERLELRADDGWLTSLSPGHVGGLALLHRAAVFGSAVLTRPRFDATEVAEILDAGVVTHASLVPVMLSRLLEARGGRPAPPRLRCLLIGGDRISDELLAEALDLGYPIALTYGMTETTSQAATASPAQVRRKPGSVGRPIAGVEMRIDPDGPDGGGEILVKGVTVVHGLPGRGEEGETPPGVWVDPEGWLHTGDRGRFDDDGDLHVVGRISDRIVTGGVTLEPAEVEEVVQRHPGVHDVAAFGLPDPEWGQRVTVAVVPADIGAPPTLEEIQAFVRGRLASAKRPRELRIVEVIPRNAQG